MNKIILPTFRPLSDPDVNSCPECQGRELLEITSCSSCYGTGKLREVPLDESELSMFPKKESEFCIFQEGSSSGNSWASNSGKAILDQVKEDDKEEEKREGLLSKLLKLLLLLLVLFLLYWLLSNGLSKYRKELPEVPKIETPKVENEKNTNSATPKKLAPGFRLSDDIMLEEYRKLSYQDISQNTSFQKFIKKNMQVGKRLKNEKVMSKKGIFHICSSFPEYKKMCLDKWFAKKSVRDRFIRRTEAIIYENEGRSYLD